MNKKRILVTGASGQLGSDVVTELVRRGYVVLGTDSRQADITDAAAVSRIFSEFLPEAVIHCAAYTAVDAAENDEKRCRLVNVCGTMNVAENCRKHGSKLIYISTDYVFGGSGNEPISADSTDFAPLNVYGRSKLDGEFAASKSVEKLFILRTSWVFGKNGGNFVKTMLELGKKHDILRVVDDQVGAPTYTRDLARLIADMAESEQYGIYNAANSGGFISRYEFAREIFAAAKTDVDVIPVSTAEYGGNGTKRPRNSRLDLSKLEKNGFSPLPDRHSALIRFLSETDKKSV